MSIVVMENSPTWVKIIKSLIGFGLRFFSQGTNSRIFVEAAYDFRNASC